MRYLSPLSVAIAALLWLTPAPLILAANDVKIHINYPDDVVYADAMNTFEVWIENDQPLVAMSLGFAITATSGSIDWVTPYGQFPSSQPPYFKVEDGASVGSWDLGGWAFRSDLLPGMFHMSGISISPSTRFSAHATSTCIVSMKLDASGLTPGDEFCVDNVFIPPAGTWSFDAGSGGFPPSFYDCPGCEPGSFENPPVCFPIVVRTWIKGDANSSLVVDISDVVFMIQFIFSGGPSPLPWQAGDANCDFKTNISDCVYLIAYIFGGGPAPC